MNKNINLIKALIAIWSLIALAGICLLVYGFYHEDSFSFLKFRNKMMNARYVVQKSQSVSVDDCSKLSLEFSTGDIIVNTTDKTSLKVVQSASRKLKDEEKFEIEKQGNNIEIRRKDENKFFHNKFINVLRGFNSNEKIELYVPKAYAENLDIKTTSGDIEFNSDMKLNAISCTQSSGDIKMDGRIVADSIGIKTTSGDIDIESLNSKYYNIQVTSGDIFIKSVSGSGNIKAISGDIKINYKSIGEYVKANATSGDVKMKVDKNLNFKFKGRCTSGDINGDFPLTYENDRKSKASGQVGKAPYKTIDVSTMSGDIDILRN